MKSKQVNPEIQPMRFLRKKEAAARVGYHPVHLMRLARDPSSDFPQPVAIGPRAIGFVESEIDEWMERRMAEREQNGNNIIQPSKFGK